MKNKKFTILLAALVISLSGYNSFPANALETITVEKIMESNNPDAIIEFTDTYVEHDKQYKLAGVETNVIESRLEEEEQTVNINQEGFYSEELARRNIPLEEIEHEGSVLYLKGSELIKTVTELRTEYGKTTIIYKGLGFIDELPDCGVVTVTDTLTGKEYKQELPRTGYRVIAESWTDDFSFPIKIYSYDADTYMLGSMEIPKGADLNQYSTEFLSVLGLSSDYYQVSNIMLQGEPYNQAGELVQDAIARGRRRVADVEATYAGHIEIPAESYWHYQCVYSNIRPGEEIGTIHTIRAIATYESEVIEDLPVEAYKSFWEHIVDIITNPGVVAIFLLLLLIVLIIFRVRRKRDGTGKQQEKSIYN